MRLLRATLVLSTVLALQAVLGRINPESHRYVDLMLLPVVWYGIARSQRSTMLVGCVAGLLQDAWFQIGVFGLNGFKKTLLGWALGGVGSRFNMSSGPGRLAAGAMLALADSALDMVLRTLLDQEAAVPGALQVLIRAVVTGLLVAGTFVIVERVRGPRVSGRWAA